MTVLRVEAYMRSTYSTTRIRFLSSPLFQPLVFIYFRSMSIIELLEKSYGLLLLKNFSAKSYQLPNGVCVIASPNPPVGK